MVTEVLVENLTLEEKLEAVREWAVQLCEGSTFQTDLGPKPNGSCVPRTLGASKTEEEQRRAEKEEPESKGRVGILKALLAIVKPGVFS